MDVRWNRLTRLPEAWAAGWPGAWNASLVNVRVSFNRLAGPFPTALATAPALTFLTLNNNSLTGPLPDAAGMFPALRAFNASHNGFTGGLSPAWAATGLFTQPPLNLGLGGLGVVHVFDVSANQLTGAVPAGVVGGAGGKAPATPVDVYLASNPALDVACPPAPGPGGVRVDVCGGAGAKRAGGKEAAPPPPATAARAPPAADVGALGAPGASTSGGMPAGAIAAIVAASVVAACAAVSLAVVAARRRRPKPPAFDAGAGAAAGGGPSPPPAGGRPSSAGSALKAALGGGGAGRGFARFEDAPGVELAPARPPA